MAGGARQYSACPGWCSATALRGSSVVDAPSCRATAETSIVLRFHQCAPASALRGRIFNNFFDVARVAAGKSVAARSAPPPLITAQRCRKCCLKKSSFDSGCSRRRGSAGLRGWCIARRAVLDEEGVCLPSLCESVCCAVVCGARALNFLCAANDVTMRVLIARNAALDAVRACEGAARAGGARVLRAKRSGAHHPGRPRTGPAVRVGGLSCRPPLSGTENWGGVQHREAPSGQPRWRETHRSQRSRLVYAF